MKKFLKYAIIIVLVAAAAVTYLLVSKNKNKPEWRTEKPSIGTVREVVTATGKINPYVLVEVGTEVSGTIDKIYKDFNSKVRKGELLARLDTENLKTSLEAARGEVEKASVTRDEAQMDFDLASDLFARGIGTQYDLKKKEYALEQAKLNLGNSRLRLQTAQTNLNNASIYSPIDGVIVARNVNEGQTVAASFSSPTLFTIANNLDHMQIIANVDEADIGRIQVKMPVEFTVDAYAGEQFQGFVQQIRLNSTTEQNVVSYSVVIDADNPGNKLLPGMTTNVTIIVQEKENVNRIPETATRFTPSKEVWEMFGLKWDDELIANARKKAMEELMKNKPEPPAAAPTDSIKAPPRPGGRPGRPGGRIGGGMPSRGMGGGGMAMIWVLKDKTPELIAVRTGVSDGAYQELVSPLDPNTVIITGVDTKNLGKASGRSAIQQGGPGMGPRF